MLDVKLKPTEIVFGEYTFIVEVNLDSRFFPSRIFSVGFETETETYEMETHVCVILRFTSGATPAECIEVSMGAKPF